jgi:putative transposase
VLYEEARRHAGRAACPAVVIMDGQSVKTTERGGARGFDAHKRVKGRKRHILVDTLGLLVANRVEPADTSDRRAGALLLGGLSGLFPRIRTIIADAGHESRKLARTLQQNQGWQLRIVKRRQRAFKITGLTWIVERSFAWLGRNRRLSKDYEYRVQTSETMIDLVSGQRRCRDASRMIISPATRVRSDHSVARSRTQNSTVATLKGPSSTRPATKRWKLFSTQR